ncbi:MAG: rRNA maturation RNase YbeY [Bacteroidales bacterium]|nr:rRNA maturation RNase YbeY [Bacteroidales bacterium]MDD4670725.1 rRNA maturation RNase YbeY [Bacteroidales bacterium]
MVSFFSEDIKFVLKQKRLISKWLKELAQSHDYKIGALNYIFCSDKYLLDINIRFLGHNYFTDIITFDYSADYNETFPTGYISGDIYISIDTVRANGETYKEGFERELLRVIAHGLLHLIGFDDTSESLQKSMTEQENKALLLFDELSHKVADNG